ncbi:MAG: flagellar brake protein [Bacillota bacterium]
MAPSVLKARQKIYVYRNDGKDQYSSVIESIKNDEITIALPLSHSSPLQARVGDLLTVRLPGDAHCFEFTTKVKGLKIDNVPLYVLSYPSEIKRVQLRQHVRLDVLLDVEYCLPPKPSEKQRYIKATTLNISAGGMKLSVPEPVSEGSIIMVKFDLTVKGTAHSFQLESKVVRVQAIEYKKDKFYHIGLQFTNISNSQKDIIYQFIFGRMAELRREGKV